MNKHFVTKKTLLHFTKLFLRAIIFLIILGLYLHDRKKFYEYTVTSPKNGLNFMHFMWLLFMTLMTLHIFPPKIMTMGVRKAKKKNYIPVEGYSEEELLKYVQEKNKRAWNAMLAWFALNAVVAGLYFTGVIGKPELLLITGFYFLSDYVCILIFCPFQTFAMKSRCCVCCRIYDWGHFFMFTPMMFMNTFYGWTLFFMGVAVIVHWEVAFTRHPERFWDGSNKALRCANCNDKTCLVKRKTNINELLKK